MSTRTCCEAPPRSRHNAAAASADAAMLEAAAVPTANDDGKAGSRPVISAHPSASLGNPTPAHSPDRTSCGVIGISCVPCPQA